MFATMTKPLETGDLIGGFLVVSTDAALRTALDEINREQSQDHCADTGPVHLHAQRQLVSAHLRKALLSPAGRLAFPDYVEWAQQTAHRPHTPICQQQCPSHRGK